MADNQTRVIYKAIADFSALSKAARKAKKDLSDLKKEEAALNAQSVAGSTASTVASDKQAKGREKLVKQFEAEAGSVRKSTANFIANANAAKQAAAATEDVVDATGEAAVVNDKLAAAIARTAAAHRASKAASDENVRSTQRHTREMGAFRGGMDRVIFGAGKLDKALNKLGNWRPRLIPPFIALIPIIGGVLALINPLIAGLGGVAAAALGFASSLGRVGAGAIGAIPALATLLSVVGALKMAFGGIGGAFKAFSNMKKATGGGGGSQAPAKAELSRTEELTRAQDAYARSIQNVAWAQEDLDEARKGYIKRLAELQKAVDRAAMSEARAAANSQLARENYANVLADPGSTKGQKMDAKVGVDEAGAEFNDVVQENKDNVEELAKMKREGANGDREVIQATRALTDAINAQRDAQLDLINTQSGANETASAAATAVDEYADAMNKLSPSARRFVEILIGMQDEWAALKRVVQESFFSQFVNDVGRLRDILPSLQSMLSDTAGALGRVVDKLLLLITSPQWQADLILIGKQNVPIIENIGAALVSWVDAFKDLSIAAGPFLIAITDGMREGAAEFQAIVANARSNGSLASYLEEVRVAMGKWWTIVKNIGMTLFNYSAAAGNFGEWLTDGFVTLSKSWRDASEEARKEGSPFQEYLENIKPLLVETRGLFGDFFRWFAREAADEQNIQMWIDIVKILREDLGPAIGRILDVLSDSGVGTAFVQAITSIVEAIATLLENGGIDGIKAFYDVITLLFDAFNTFLSSVPTPVLSLLASTLGTIAALRFFGLTKVLGLFLALAKGGRIGAIVKSLAGFLGIGGTLATPGTVAGAAGAAGAASGAGTAAGAAGGAAAAAAGKQKGFSLLGSIAKGAGKGVGIAAIASIAGTVAGDLIASGAADGGAGAGQRVGGGLVGGIATGAGIGAIAGNLIPIPGVGAGIGAAVGAVAGGATALATASPEDREVMFQEMGHFFEDAAKNISDWWTNTVVPAWEGLATGISDAWNNFVVIPLQTLGTTIGDWWYEHVIVPWELVSTAIGDWWYNEVVVPMAHLSLTIAEIWDKYVTQPFNALVMTIQALWQQYVVTPFSALIVTIQSLWNTYVVIPFQNLVAVMQSLWQTYVVTPFNILVATIQSLWQQYVVTPFNILVATIQALWQQYVVTPFNNLVAIIQSLWQTYVVNPFNLLVSTIQGMWQNRVVVPFETFIGIIRSLWEDRVVKPFETVIGVIKAAWEGFWKQFENFNLIEAIDKILRTLFLGGGTGGPPGNAGQGGGPTLARVKSVLPSGMGISSTYRSPAENARAGGSPTSLHMDKNNPAVDIVGSIGQMNAFARILGAMGGWRQLYYNNIKAPGVGYWPGHSDHIHVANTGGKVPGRGNGDTVKAMLTPGEFVVRKAITDRIGPENLARLNSGVLSFADLLRQAHNQPAKIKEPGLGDNTMFLNGGGLVSEMGSWQSPGYQSASQQFPAGVGAGNGMHFGDIIINNPVPETASESLPRTIRKVAYLGASR